MIKDVIFRCFDLKVAMVNHIQITDTFILYTSLCCETIFKLHNVLDLRRKNTIQSFWGLSVLRCNIEIGSMYNKNRSEQNRVLFRLDF